MGGFDLASISQPPPRILLADISWLSNVCTTRKDSESEWLAKDNLEMNPFMVKKTQDWETHGRAVRLDSLTQLLFAQVPLPNKISCFISTCVSSDIHF